MGRRKGNSAFPVARIKKIMQADDDVGKIATVTPVLVAKALECMMEHVLTEAAQVAHARHTKTVTPQHLRHCVANNDHFDFLRPTLAHIAPLEDHHAPSAQPSARRSRPKRPRSPIVRQPSLAKLASSSTSTHVQGTTVSALSKRHKAHSPVLPSISAPQLPQLVPTPKNSGSAADDDDDNYDDDDDDKPVPSKPSISAPVLLPPIPNINEKEDSKASERVSVNALLS